MRKHGLWKSPTHNSWTAMKGRCNNKNHPKYKDYGLRGISICPQWDLFENFLSDMGLRPPGKTLGRKNNNKGYFKKNCEWQTPIQQAQNRRPRKKRLLKIKFTA